MRSSGSTPSPPRRRSLELRIVLAGEDHPKACTGRRLLRWGRAVRAPAEARAAARGVVLDPYAPTPLSPADRRAAEDGGVLAVDCSWNRLSERGRFPGTEAGTRPVGRRRRLPLLVATNPQHYGRVAQLNTVEALSAAVYILGRPLEARDLLAGFRGGDDFLEVNRERLERYRRAAAAEDIGLLERNLFGGV